MNSLYFLWTNDQELTIHCRICIGRNQNSCNFNTAYFLLENKTKLLFDVRQDSNNSTMKVIKAIPYNRMRAYRITALKGVVED